MPYARKGRWVYYWHSSSEVFGVRFVAWCRMQMSTGGEDTNNMGTGAILWSPWMYRHPKIWGKPDRGLRRGYHRLAPYHQLYSTYNGAWAHKNESEIIRPHPSKVKNKRKYNLVVRQKKTVNRPRKKLR